MKKFKVNYIISRYMHGDRQGFTDEQILSVYSKYLESRREIK